VPDGRQEGPGGIKFPAYVTCQRQSAFGGKLRRASLRKNGSLSSVALAEDEKRFPRTPYYLHLLQQFFVEL